MSLEAWNLGMALGEYADRQTRSGETNAMLFQAERDLREAEERLAEAQYDIVRARTWVEWLKAQR